MPKRASEKVIIPLSRTTTYRYKPGTGLLVNKLPNMRPQYGFEKNVVPELVASNSAKPTRMTNKSGRPTR